MKRIFVILLTCVSLNLVSAKIKDLQFTLDSGYDGTYPSQLKNKVVDFSGVVTAVNVFDNFSVIADSKGEWSSILIQSNNLNLGDKFKVKAKISEYFGMTCADEIIKLKKISSGAFVKSERLTTGQIADQEKWESVLVSVSDVELNHNYINDGSGSCKIDFSNISSRLRNYSNYEKITGIMTFTNGEFVLIPRNDNDIRNNTTSVNENSWGRVKSLYK